MKKFIVLLLFFFSFIFDIVFFDYDLSDIKHIKADVSEIDNEIEKSLNMILPFYFNSLGFAIKNCKQISTYKPVVTNVFERDILLQLQAKCNLKNLIKKAKIGKKDFIANIKLSDLSKWDKELYFDYSCKKNKVSNLTKYKNFNTGTDLENNNIIKIYSSTDKSIVFVNKDLNRVFFVKEILRANFNNDNINDVLLEISVTDSENNYVECVNHAIFTRENLEEIMREKNI